MPAHNLQPISVLIAGSLLLGAVAWWAFSTPEVIDPGRPSWKGADIDNLVASVPEIDKFMAFYVNDENPFVPFNLRVAERNSYDPKRRIARTQPNTTTTTVARIKPPRPPVDVVEQIRPKLVLPKLSPAPPDAPVVFGFVGSGNEQALLVRMPGAEQSIRMVPGNKVDDWTLVAIDNGNMATFLDPRGLEHRYAIGEGDLAINPEGDGNVEGTKGTAETPAHVDDKMQKGKLPLIDTKNMPRPLPLPERRPRERPKDKTRENDKK